MDSFQCLLIAPASVLFAPISKGGFASGAAFMAAATLISITGRGYAIGLMLPLLMLMDAVSLKAHREKWLTLESFYPFLGGMPGIALGI